MCRSANRTILRRMACARLSSPTISARSRGVLARHAALAATRRTKSATIVTPAVNASSPVLEGSGRGESAEQARGHSPDHAPGEDHGGLVHGQVTHHPVVGVVEPGQLRDQNPGGQEGQHPDGALRRQGERQSEADRAAVRKGEEPAAADVAPPSRLGGRRERMPRPARAAPTRSRGSRVRAPRIGLLLDSKLLCSSPGSSPDLQLLDGRLTQRNRAQALSPSRWPYLPLPDLLASAGD